MSERQSILQPGRVLHPEEIIEEISGNLEVYDEIVAQGGYSDIFRGRWTSPQGAEIDVAVKEIKTHRLDTGKPDVETLQQKRIRRELFIWSRTTHPNLQPLLGYASQPRPRLICPWCRHGNLTKYLDDNPGLSRLDKLLLIYQTSLALKHLHSQEPPICHADIKPENVLVNDSREASLSDFGLSRILEDTSSGLTTSGSAKGTPNYMAPELYFGQGNPYSLGADIYAFGGLILKVMSGKAPFYNVSSKLIWPKVVRGSMPDPQNHSSLPASDPLWKLMRRCWAKDPHARLPALEVSAELLVHIHHEKWKFPMHSNVVLLENRLSNFDLRCPEGQTPSEAGILAEKILIRVESRSKSVPVIGRYLDAVVHVGHSLLNLIKTAGQNNEVFNRIAVKTWKLAQSAEDLCDQGKDPQRKMRFDIMDDIRSELGGLHETIEDLRVSGREYVDEKTAETLEMIELLGDVDAVALLRESSDALRERRRLLDRLGDGKYGALGDAIEDVVCFPGTRTDVVGQIDRWIRSQAISDRVMWIHGMAGRGKSTIASTVIQNWKYRATCAIFHFRRGQTNLDVRIICALAKQIGESIASQVSEAVVQSVRENEDIVDKRLDEQFQTLLVAPLAELGNWKHPIIIIIDGLDECEDPRHVNNFVKLIERHSSSFPKNVKLLLTSRPESQIMRLLQSKAWPRVDLDSTSEIRSDLTKFIQHECEQIRVAHRIEEQWPSYAQIAQLVDMSQGLFQWARTATSYLDEKSPEARLDDLLDRPTAWNGLDEMYHQILKQAFNNLGSDPRKQKLFCQTLGTLVVAPYPVSLDMMPTFLTENWNNVTTHVDRRRISKILREEILADLKSLITIPDSPNEPLNLIHTSVRDLLADNYRCKEGDYHVNTTHHHIALATSCLRHMRMSLRKNILNITSLTTSNAELQERVEKELSPSLRYCCLAWPVHLTNGMHKSLGVETVGGSPWDSFVTFSRQMVLSWLEVMILIAGPMESVKVASLIQTWLSELAPNTEEITVFVTLWHDIERFVALFAEPISFGIIHIYTSALAQCPRMTLLWKWYGHESYIKCLGNRGLRTWPPNVWTRKGSWGLERIAFSPDSRILGVASGRVIQLWDIGSGTALGDPLQDHMKGESALGFFSRESDKKRINCFVLSPDGRTLVSGSEDGTIRLWDFQSGTTLGDPLQGDHYAVRCISLSPDGRTMASGSDDGTIRLWDVQSGTALGDPLPQPDPHIYFHGSPLLSPDWRTFASDLATWDGTIRLWDVQRGRRPGKPRQDRRRVVGCISSSPDGSILASGSGDRTIRIWSVQNGDSLGDPLTLSVAAQCMSFSPDGNTLGSSAWHGTIRLWDLPSGGLLGDPFRLKAGVECTSLSPDGRTLASSTTNGTIRLWDIQSGTALGDLRQGHEKMIKYLSFSPDGKSLASCSGDGTIRLWDFQSATTLGDSLHGFTDPVVCISFSPDESTLALGSWSGTVHLWDVQSGIELGDPLQCHSGPIYCMSFSPDVRTFASASYDGTIRLHNVDSGIVLGYALKSITAVACMSFSPDGGTLASVSSDGTIQLWDIQSEIPLGYALESTIAIACISFSPDGSILASCSQDGVIQIWDVQSRMALGNAFRSTTAIACISFSSDGTTLASCSLDGKMQLWDAQSRIALEGPPQHDYFFSPFHANTPIMVSEDARDQRPAPIFTRDGGWIKMHNRPLIWLSRDDGSNHFPTSVYYGRRALAVVLKDRVYLLPHEF